MQYNVAMHEIGLWDEGLIMSEFAPSAPLQGYIKSYQLLTGQNHFKPKRPWYILPDNGAHLIFYLFEKEGQLCPSLRLIGPRTAHRLTDRATRHLTFIASFKPGALWYFCHQELAELTDQATSASELLQGISDELLEAFCDAAKARAIDQLILLMEKLLLHNIGPCPQATKFLSGYRQIRQDPGMKVKGMARELGISERHLRSLTHKYIGHAPKDILQITRFTHSLVLSNEHREWPAIALDAGFYDQSHMIATFQKMCGKSPENLFYS